MQRLKKVMTDRFVMTDMGEVSLILGMAVTRDYDTGTLAIILTYYLKDILGRFGMLDGNPVPAPAG